MTKKINYKKLAICFLILFLASGIYLIFEGNKPYEELSKNITCSEIKYTPAWVKDNKILGYGYRDWKELPEGVSFYYQTKCSVCHKQIANFNEEYLKQMQKEGRVINCD